MNAFRVISIIWSLIFIALLVLTLYIEQYEIMIWIIVVMGIITAIFNIISTAMWWIKDKKNKENELKLRWIDMGFH